MNVKKFGSIYLDRKENRWVIKKLEPHARIVLKNIFTKIRITKQAPFYFPNNLSNCFDLEWFMQRYPLEISDEDNAKLISRKRIFQDKRDKLTEIIDINYKSIPIKLKKGYSLRNYQAQAVELLKKNNFLLLGDDLGLGKTVSAIGALAEIKALPAIIVVPSHLAIQWQNEIRKFTNLRVAIVEKSSPRQYKLPPKKDVYIMRYSGLQGWQDTFEELGFKTVIFDEAHYLRRDVSKRYEGAKELTKHSQYNLGLTASPIYNRGEEIFNILNILNEDGLGYKEEFMREWTNYDNHIKDPQAFGTYLRENFMFLRRTPEEVGRELPEINKIIQNVDFDEKLVRDHEKLMKSLALRILQGSTKEERFSAGGQLDLKLRQVTGISKARAIAKYVEILLQNGRQVVVAGWHREVYRIWESILHEYNPLYYTGSESPKQKNETLAKFKNPNLKDHNLMFMSLKSVEGVDGLQYTDCKDIVFGELDWSPAKHEQAIGRLRRDGQNKQVTAHYLVSDSGSDPLMIQLLGVKANQARGIIDPFKGVEKVFSEKKKMKILAEMILDKGKI